MAYIPCFCVDRFLTNAAENELRHVQNGIYIPSSMDITTVDCSLVQEGGDNVDINCQTIDAMGRVLFQEQATNKAPTQERIPRVPEKNLVMSNEIDSLIKIYPFAKPTVQSEAQKTVGAFGKLHALQTSRSNMPNNYTWIILCLLSH